MIILLIWLLPRGYETWTLYPACVFHPTPSIGGTFSNYPLAGHKTTLPLCPTGVVKKELSPVRLRRALSACRRLEVVARQMSLMDFPSGRRATTPAGGRWSGPGVSSSLSRTELLTDALLSQLSRIEIYDTQHKSRPHPSSLLLLSKSKMCKEAPLGVTGKY